MWFLFGNALKRKIPFKSYPKVWVMMNHRAGENTQLLALAEALGWPFEIKRFTYRKRVPYLLLQASLAGIDKSASDALTPPWPDLIISASARNEPICRWVQQQAAKSGHRVRLVHIGRPWQRLDRFDLVITTPQYRLPRRPNVLHNGLTLHRVTASRLEQEVQHWKARLAHLPSPRIAVMIGGSSGPYILDKNAARRLAVQVNRLASNMGASLLVTTSARTRPGILNEFKSAVTVPAYYFEWSKAQKQNPYYAFLGMADQIVVTADSVSMLTEAVATAKPVHIFNLLVSNSNSFGSWFDWNLEAVRAHIYRWAMRWAPKRLTRDVSLVHQRIISEGQAVWLGQTGSTGDNKVLSLKDLDLATARVRALFGEKEFGLLTKQVKSIEQATKPAMTA